MAQTEIDLDYVLNEPYTHQISKRIGIRIYNDSRPHYLEISSLHKGLILVFDGLERVEEGAGFGVPIIKYSKTYFPGSAQCWLEKTDVGVMVVKVFEMNSIARKRVGKSGYINDSLYRFLRKQFERFYLGSFSSGILFNKLMEFRKIAGIETKFIHMKSKGQVTVRYSFVGSQIDVDVDLTNLEMDGCQEILLLNEQGATFFAKYSDASGLCLSEGKISGWTLVNAENASLSDKQGELTFTVNSNSTCRLFRGREKTKDRFSWSGLSYSLMPPQKKFRYSIKIREKTVSS